MTSKGGFQKSLDANTRSRTEDATALAFAKLPAMHRAVLLSGRLRLNPATQQPKP